MKKLALSLALLTVSAVVFVPVEASGAAPEAASVSTLNAIPVAAAQTRRQRRRYRRTIRRERRTIRRERRTMRRERRYIRRHRRGYRRG
jgi:hypothetical protein